uniref:Secreted protein n=1 Tax=Heterorhabditis bacteriophora TaxID=37862 RepID=A0A1I7XLB0_HETBA
MVWGAFSAMGLVDLDCVDEDETAWTTRIFTFQRDNATIHASRSMKTCWRTMTWTLDWLSRSPDLNPMKNFEQFSCIGFMATSTSLRPPRTSKVPLAKRGAKQTKVSSKT